MTFQISSVSVQEGPLFRVALFRTRYWCPAIPKAMVLLISEQSGEEMEENQSYGI